MALIHVKDEYAIPRGRSYFDPYDANEALTGEIPFGNCPGVTVTIDTEKAEHYSSQTAEGEKDKTQTTRINRTGALNCDNVSMSNYALWLAGTRQAMVQAAVAVTDEVRTVQPGRFYQLGATAANPVGVRNVTMVTVKPAVGEDADTYVAGEDYNVDLETGRVQIMEGGAIVAGDVSFGYTPVAGTFERVMTGGLTEITGALRIVADNASGANRDFYMPKVTLTPTGDLPLVAEGTDFVQLQFTLDVLKPTNAQAIYADGRPVAA